eukprot:760602-Hanusia_phi.AAC.1
MRANQTRRPCSHISTAGSMNAAASNPTRHLAHSCTSLPSPPSLPPSSPWLLVSSLRMLANIEARLEEHLSAIERMPQEEVNEPLKRARREVEQVEKAEKEREKERRSRVRTEKMAAQKKQQE